MPATPRPVPLRAVAATVEATQAELARSTLAGEPLVLVALDAPSRAYVVHRDHAIELAVHADDVPGAGELRATVARTAISQLVAERTWRGRAAAAWDALHGR